MRFTIEAVSQLKWCDSEHTVLECLVKYKEFSEAHPTGVMQNDCEEHIRVIWERALAGEYGEIAEYEQPVEQVPDIVIGLPDTSDQVDFPVAG